MVVPLAGSLFLVANAWHAWQGSCLQFYADSDHLTIPYRQSNVMWGDYRPIHSGWKKAGFPISFIQGFETQMAATENIISSASKGTQSTSTAEGDVEHVAVKQTATLRSYLMADVDPAQTTAPLAAYCFMTGFMWVGLIFLSYPSCTHPNTAMLFLFRQSSFGVVSKPVILPR